MTRTMFILLASAALGLATGGSASAQANKNGHNHSGINNPYRSYGVGIGISVGGGGYGPYGYPGFGYPGYRGYGYPGFGYPYYGAYLYDYPGFYGNGMSKYGPPVPTYGVVPGAFGGSDYRVNQNAPFFGLGGGWYGYRSPSPRPTPNFDFNPPVILEKGEPKLLNGEIVEEPVQKSMLAIRVSLPIENAIVFVNDEVTKQTGAVRLFTSPLLPAGEEVQYEIRAEWIINGEKISRTKTVTGKTGSNVVVEFE